MATKRNFTPDPILTAIAIAFRNKHMIADEVMMRTPPLAKEAFKYKVWNLEDGFTIPDTKVGRRGKVNEVETSSVDVDASTEDFGLEDPIPQSDIDNDTDGSKVISRSTEFTRNLIMLDREVRVSSIAFSAASYAANNVEVIAAGDRFDDDVNPIPMLNDSMAVPIMRPNVWTIGEIAWNKLSVNPYVVKAAHGNSGDAGIASVDAVRKLFRLDKLLIGQARVNTARKGQDPNIQTAWGNSLSMTYQDVMADNRNGTTWGFTAQHGKPFAAQWFDKDIGLKGGQRVRVGESVKEVVSAKDLGYLLETVTNA